MSTSSEGRQKPVSRQALYELVWTSPMGEVAGRFGVSGSYLARVCKELNVPRPSRGHWAKVAAGKTTPARADLPAAHPGDPQVWQRGVWPPYAVQVEPVAPDPEVRRRRRSKGPLPGLHPLLNGVREVFEESRGSLLSDYLKPRTRKLPDIVVTKSAIRAAVAFANQLYLSMEVRGYRVSLAARDWATTRPDFDERETATRRGFTPNLWTPSRLTTAYLGSVPFGLTVVELSEHADVEYVDGSYVRISDLAPAARRRAEMNPWRHSREMPSGRFMLLAYSPEPSAGWRMEWREAWAGELIDKLPAIVAELEEAAPKVAILMKEGRERDAARREAEAAAHAQWLIKEERRRQEVVRQQGKEELLSIMKAWAEARSIRAFLAEAENEIRGAGLQEDERQNLLDRLALARELTSAGSPVELLTSWRPPKA